MLKKINVQDVRLGMFIEKLNGSWMDHPFWKKAFKLENEKDLHALQASGVDELWIDISKGVDVESGQSSEVTEEKVAGALPATVGSDKKQERQVALHEETPRAQKIHAKAKKMIASVLGEARMGNVLQLAEAAALVDEIIQSVSRNSGALLSLSRLKSKDDHAYLHSVAVSALMIALGRQMGLEGDTLKSLGMAGLLHDVGKVMIPDKILNKPSKLNTAEFEIVKTHSRRGWEILKADPDMDEVVLDVCLHHHERMDGTGYPDKLPGESLSRHARMAALCDVYDALTSDCSYRTAYAPADAVRKMAELQDGHFDKTLFHAFVKTVGIYPVGTLVKLKSGRLAVVADQSAKSLLSPIVKVFFSTNTNEPIFPVLVELSKVPDTIASVEDPAEWKLDLKAMAGI
jgi:HD-GYP domain-containing protein (c-di-GMP phosphodiesterase class II)